ncbi:MAG: hypothetical protein FJZ90_16760 [Chloroflexi bacterium]|nr:hypothetical protein [Chloroflexota bacterium]
MKRVEWIALALLAIVTLFTLSAVSPAAEQANPSGWATDALASWMNTALLGTPSPTPTARTFSTPTATPRATPKVSGRFAEQRLPTPIPTQEPTATASPTATPFPFDTRADLPRYIYVDQGAQHLYVFEQGVLLRDIPCSTGLPDPDKYTPAWAGAVGDYWGTFFAYDVYADEAWYLFKSAGSILVHSLPYVYQNGYKAYQDRDALGIRPASHGCIRIAPEDAAWLTQWNPKGVLMTVSDPYRDKWLGLMATATPASPRTE